MIFAVIALKLEKGLPNFFKFQSILQLPSVASEDRKQFQFLNLV